MDHRLRAVCDLSIPWVREGAGRHEYDGQVQDLSPEGVRRGLAALGEGDRLADPFDEAFLATFEADLRLQLGELEVHRRSPLPHLDNLDVSGYDRDYAPLLDREAAKRAHLAHWPDAVQAALASLDAVPAPVAQALLPAVRGLTAGLAPGSGDPVIENALAAHARLVDRIAHLAEHGDPNTALGGDTLARVMGVPEALEVDLDALAARADTERDRLADMLTEACAKIAPGRPVAEVVPKLLADHPDADGVLAEARVQVAEALAFTREHELAPYTDGECLVGPAPESRSWAMAMMAWSAPHEPEGPSWYWVTPPNPAWPAHEREEWLSVFSRTTLPAVTVHEVSPGHYAHGRALRRAGTEVRRTLMSSAFAEGWAHYGEQVCVEEGFHAHDPRFAAGVAIEALVRVTRLACAIGLHTGEMDVDAATDRFVRDAHQSRAAAASEARRGTFDPGYGRYTWGKLVLQDLRETARTRWGADFSLPRYHRELLALGSPPLGLVAGGLGLA